MLFATESHPNLESVVSKTNESHSQVQKNLLEVQQLSYGIYYQGKSSGEITLSMMSSITEFIQKAKKVGLELTMLFRKEVYVLQKISFLRRIDQSRSPMIKELINELKNSECWRENLVMLMESLEDADRKMVRKHLSSFIRIRYPRWRKNYYRTM